MPTLRFPLVGSIINRGVAPDSNKDQVFINCYPEIVSNPISGKGTAYLYKRPGYTSGGSITGATAGNSFGIVQWSGSTATFPPVAVGFQNTGGTTTSVWDVGAGTQIGSDIANTTNVLSMTETVVSGTAHLVGTFIDGSTIEQWYFPAGGAWTQVSDADFTAHTLVGAPAHLDGYVFNMTLDGKVVNSDLNSVSAYTAGNYLVAGNYPDKGVTVARLENRILAFGEQSIEILRNAGNATGSPLVREGAIRMGTLRYFTSEQTTVLSAFGTIFFTATTSDGAISGVYRFKGFTPEKISTPAIDKLLMSEGLRGFCGSMQLHGMRHVLMTDTLGINQFAFCIDTGVWWKLTLASGSVQVCAAADAFGNGDARTYFTGPSVAILFFQNESAVHQDNSANFTMFARTAPLDHGTHKRKFFKSLALIGDTQASASVVTVKKSDDDDVSQQTLGTIDMGSATRKLHRIGSSRRRSWIVEQAANTACRLEAMEIEYEVGA